MMTMQEVARRAGVSRAAVSHVLNGRAQAVGLCAATCRRIRTVLTESGYRRNEAARAMVQGRTRIVAFLSPSIREAYCSEALDGVLAAANRRNLFVKVFTWHSRAHATDFERALDHCLQARPVGIIARGLLPAEMDALYAGTRTADLPLVMVDSSTCVRPWNVRVRADDEAGITLAWEHLLALGHRRIVHLTGLAEFEFVRLRSAAFQACQRRASGRLRPDDIFYGRETEYADVVTRWFRRPPEQRPTAVICASDNIAAVLVRQLRGLGLRVPEDVSVTGFGDLSVGWYCDPPLTTIRQPFHRMGARALLQVVSRTRPPAGAAAPRAFKDVALPVKLVQRASTGMWEGG